MSERLLAVVAGARMPEAGEVSASAFMRRLHTLWADLKVQEAHIVQTGASNAKVPIMLKALNADLRFEEALSKVSDGVREQFMLSNMR